MSLVMLVYKTLNMNIRHVSRNIAYSNAVTFLSCHGESSEANQDITCLKKESSAFCYN